MHLEVVMLKSNKNHFVPEFDKPKHAMKNFGGYDEYDPMSELDPIELGLERIEVIKQWLVKENRILGALLIGSYARSEQREDSDIDLIFIVENIDEWIDTPQWVKRFGPVMSQTDEVYEDIKALRVYYKDNVEIEFGFTSKAWLDKPFKETTKEALDGGYVILSNKRHLLDDLG